LNLITGPAVEHENVVPTVRQWNERDQYFVEHAVADLVFDPRRFTDHALSRDLISRTSCGAILI